MASLISPEQSWPIAAVVVAGAAASIGLEQRVRWAARLSGPVLALAGGMLLSNLRFLPTEAPVYDFIETYLVPVAIPLLLLRANVTRIFRETGPMLRAFHVATLGTLIGALLAGWLFRGKFPQWAESAGVMAASYIGGSVNFVAVVAHYKVTSNVVNPLIVADNFIMAAMFGVLFLIARSRFFRRHYPHPHSLTSGEETGENRAAQYWERKGVSLLDLAMALALAFAIAAVSVQCATAVRNQTNSPWILAFFGSAYLPITVVTVLVTTIFHKQTDRINGATELGALFLQLFFFVLGLHADLAQVLHNGGILLAFCTVIAVVNLAVTLIVGRLFRMNLEELLLAVNATLGGPPSAIAMAVSAGWPKLALPGLLAGLWGYIIGTFLGIAIAEIFLRWYS